MKCENYLCLYWEADQCTVDEISVDMQGRCDVCLYIPLENTYVEEQRQRWLKRLDDDLAELLTYRCNQKE